MDLSVNYLGKRFDNPFVLAAGPPSANADMISRAFEAGWAGAVVKTLIKEPVKNYLNRFASNRIGDKIIAFQNIELLSEMTPDDWYRDIKKIKDNYPCKILIASIMGDARSPDQWIELGIGCQEAGADFLELNFSCPHGYPEKGKGAAIGQNAEYSARIVEWIAEEQALNLPVIVKMTGAVPDISYIGEAVAAAGADGFCAINTFPAIMGFDLNTLKPKASVAGYSTAGGYSGPGLKPIALRCVSDLAKSPGLPIMGGGGIDSGYDAAEFILLGASIIQVCTAVMLSGFDIITKLKEELMEFMSWHEFTKIDDFIGIGNKQIKKFSELDNEYSVKASVDHEICRGCTTCFVACRDAGYQAIEIQDMLAQINRAVCRGCSLCFQVCPTGAITMEEC
ncbi:NAD-dependent dihydropyrimidine dehydrogenase subunit PreA [bacterium]|nr:NAD-dependent dihydropyrimidine dehydrogenase subunit PreA [bacterium]